MINQAMITNSLIKSCSKLKQYCSESLSGLIDANAVCLVNSYEYLFDQKAGLYRSPYGSKFRYDGLYAPWNWHLTWAAVLQHVGKNAQQTKLEQRAFSIVKQFTQSWNYTDEESSRVLWRYWTPHYYQGWSATDKVSLNRPKQVPVVGKKLRYEDLNHAGLSLMGLNFINYPITKKQQQGLSNTIDHLLNFGQFLPRDMDGNGPQNPRWSLGAGWHSFATTQLKSLFATKLPGAVSSTKHLAYAYLGQGEKTFNLTFTLSQCSYSKDSQDSEFNCKKSKSWTWNKVSDFFAKNPLFEITSLNRI